MGIADVANVVSNPSSILEFFTPFQTTIDDIDIDVLRAETLTHSWTITERPVEAGLNITDARIKIPDVLVLDCLLANDELELSVSSITSLLNGIDTWEDKRDKLYKLMSKDVVLEISTPFYEYSNMLIKDIRTVRDVSTSQGYFFRIEFKEVRLVESAISDIDISQLPDSLKAKINADNEKANKASSKKKKQGKKAPEEASTKSKSIIAGLIDGFLA